VNGYPVVKHSAPHCGVCGRRDWQIWYVRPQSSPVTGKQVFAGWSSFPQCDDCRLDAVLGVLNLAEPWQPPPTKAQLEAGRLRALGLDATAAALAGGAPWKPPAGVLDPGPVFVQPWTVAQTRQQAIADVITRQASGDLGAVGRLSAAMPPQRWLDCPPLSPDPLTRANVSLTLGAGPVLGVHDVGPDPNPNHGKNARLVLECLTVLSARGSRTVVTMSGKGLFQFVNATASP
jgi:hypothetical protein